MADLDFAGLNRQLLTDSKNLLSSWLPGGKLRGREYTCAGIAGGIGSSMSVNINTGAWMDGAVPEHRGGDLISLYATIKGIGMGEAYRELGGSAEVYAAPVSLDPPEKPLVKPPHGIAPVLSNAVANWCYRDELGDPLFYIARYNKTDGKFFRPWSWDGESWVNRGWPAPRPVYGLELLSVRPNDPVLIVEGEKACEVIRELGTPYIAITWANGAAATGTVDWSVLKGRKVLLWPDADAAGIAAMEAIAKQVNESAAEVKWVDTEGLEKGTDAADMKFNDWAEMRAWAAPRVRVWTEATVVATPVPSAPEATVTVVEDAQELTHSLVALYETHGIAVTSHGIALCNADNAHRVITSVPGFNETAFYDEFSETIRRGDGEEWSDVDTSRLLIRMQRELGMSKIGKHAVLDALSLVAHERKRNIPLEWVESLKWDGTERLPTFFHKYFSTTDDEYAKIIGMNWWVSMMARLSRPGCQVDTMLILEGGQGLGKSSALSIIGGKWYAIATASVSDPKAFAETLRGKLIMEVAELSSFGKADAKAIKRILSDRSDRYRDSYGHFAADHPRRGILTGSTNESAYLEDNTGARRFWPMSVGVIDLEGLRRDREQLFAEAMVLYKRGWKWHLVPGEALVRQEGARQHDELESHVQEYIEDKSSVTISDVWCNGLNFALKDLKRTEQLRIAGILRTRGWERGKWPEKVEGRSVWLFRPIKPPF